MLRGRSLEFWRRWARARVFILPAVVLLAVTLPHLGQGDFRGDAGWYSAIGLQAWRTGELWTLYADPGQAYFNKPPLAFWVHGLSLHIMGPSVWSARLPSVLAALGCIIATVGLARELAGRRAAVFSGIVLALSLDFFRRTREISLDMWQTLFLLLALWCIARGVSHRRHGWVLLAGVPVGLALLTKPLTALLLFPIIAAWLLWMGRARILVPLAGAALLALSIAAPWHISMWRLHGEDFTAQYFGAEIARRASGELQAGHAKPPPAWFYAQFLLEGFWPWLIFVVLALVTLARGGAIARSLKGPALALIWAAAWIALLTLFPDRRDRYALVFLPALAWLAGMWLSAAPYPRKRGAMRVLLRGLGPAVVIAGTLLALLPVKLQKGRDQHWQELFAWTAENTSAADSPRLWQGGIEASIGARFYVEFGEWPHPTTDRRGQRTSSPPRGALILYHHRSAIAPGEGERVLFISHNGDLVVTRLESGDWMPRPRDLAGD